jgi:hypothetical protein
MLSEAAKKGERDAGAGGDRKSPSSPARVIPKLADIGVSYDQSSKWQQVAELTDEEFEEALETTKAVTHEISTRHAERTVR